jgi:hypothetical protein
MLEYERCTNELLVGAVSRQASKLVDAVAESTMVFGFHLDDVNIVVDTS